MSVETAEAGTGAGSEQTDMFAQTESVSEASADGTGGGGGSGDPPVPAAADDFADLPEEFKKNAMESDPELKALVEGKKPDADKGGEDHDADGSSGKDSASDGQTQEPKADDSSGKEEAPAQFADDVIPGLKGEVFGKLPEEAQEAVAKFYQEALEKTQKADSVSAAVEALKQDPYLRSRIAAAEAGMPAQPRSISQEEAQSISALLAEKLGLNVDEDEGERAALSDAMAALIPGIDAIAKQMAQDYAGRSLQIQETVKEAREANRRADALLFGLSEFDKGLALKETAIDNFYAVDPKTGKTVLNERHPEIEKYKNGIGKFVQWAFDHGFDNRQIVKMGAKAFYAAAAADMGKTVAINTADRDKKIAADARKNAINLFRKPGGGALSTQGTAPASKAGSYMENGIDVTRLASDGDYYDALMAQRLGDRAWIEKLSELESKGRAILNGKQAR